MILLLLVFTGCDITYNLTIGDNYSENILINEQIYGNDDDELMLRLNNGIPLYSDFNHVNKFYKYSIDRKGDNFSLSLLGVFNSTNQNSYSVSNTCNNYSVSESNGKKVLSASDFFLFDNYVKLNSIKIIINYKGNVISNNADSIDGNKYTWIINRDNYKDKTINFIYDKNDGVISSNYLKDNPMITFSLALVFILIIFLIIYLFVKFRFKRKNSL